MEKDGYEPLNEKWCTLYNIVFNNDVSLIGR